MEFNKLYKKNSDGSIQVWTIEVDDATIITSSGKLDGKMVESRDEIRAGKNIGTIKETTPDRQAELEARSKYKKQLKKGYVTSLEDALAGKTDSIIQGGVLPMLAHKYSEYSGKIVFDAVAQPKLDGERCICVVSDFVPTLWTRSRKPINSMPHIVEAIRRAVYYCSIPNIIFDGELYNHGYKDKFEELMSVIRKDNPSQDSVKVQYHIYDIVDDKLKFVDRYSKYRSVIGGTSDYLEPVESEYITSDSGLMKYLDNCLNLGYEGAMVRNANSLYVGRRSYDLQKVKIFQDAEFRVVGMKEGRGKLTGHVGSFICRIDDDLGTRTFDVKAEGAQSFLREAYLDERLWTNKMLTVRFQGYTNANRVPRFPVGVRFRD